MEKDRTLIMLSAGGIGVLASLLATQEFTRVQFVLAVLAGILFLVSTVCGIAVFGRNSTHIESVLRGEATGDDPWLISLDTLMMASFVCGAVATLVVSGAVGFTRLERREQAMAEKQVVTVERSLTGIGRLPQQSGSGGSGAGSGQSGGSSSGSTQQGSGQQQGNGQQK